MTSPYGVLTSSISSATLTAASAPAGHVDGDAGPGGQPSPHRRVSDLSGRQHDGVFDAHHHRRERTLTMNIFEALSPKNRRIAESGWGPTAEQIQAKQEKTNATRADEARQAVEAERLLSGDYEITVDDHGIPHNTLDEPRDPIADQAEQWRHEVAGIDRQAELQREAWNATQGHSPLLPANLVPGGKVEQALASMRAEDAEALRAEQAKQAAKEQFPKPPAHIRDTRNLAHLLQAKRAREILGVNAESDPQTRAVAAEIARREQMQRSG